MYIHLVLLLLFLTCEDPVQQNGNSFTISFVQPEDDMSLETSSVNLQIKIDNPENIDQLDILINDNIWRRPNPVEKLNLAFYPPSGLDSAKYKFYLIAKNSDASLSDSITLYLTTHDTVYHSDAVFLPCCNETIDFYFMKYPKILEVLYLCIL